MHSAEAGPVEWFSSRSHVITPCSPAVPLPARDFADGRRAEPPNRWQSDRILPAHSGQRTHDDCHRARWHVVVHRNGGQPHRPHGAGRNGASRNSSLPNPGERAAHHHHWPRRQFLVHRTSGQSHRPDHSRRSAHRVSDSRQPNSQPRAITLGPDGNLWFGEFMGGRIGRITPQGVITEFPIPTPNSGPRAIAAGADGNLWFSEFNAGKIGRMTPNGEVTEFVLPRPNSGPGDITAGADGNMWFLLLNGRMDDRQVDGNRVGRITPDGTITEFAIPSQTGSPINIAVGPDRNIWFTKQSALGRVTPDGVITEFPVPSGGTGLTAGSDRRPPDRLTDRLWYAASGANKIGFLSFR